MTSRPTTKSPDATRRGFTLAELLLVLVLAVVLAALVAPSLSGSLSRARLDGAADTVRTAWANARLEAIRTGEPVAFQCRLGTGEFTLARLADAAAALEGSTEVADRRRLAADEHEDLGAVTFVQLSLGDPDLPGADPSVAACLVFGPDGATDDAFAILADDRGRRRRVVLRGLTGGAKIDEAPAAEAAP